MVNFLVSLHTNYTKINYINSHFVGKTPNYTFTQLIKNSANGIFPTRTKLQDFGRRDFWISARSRRDSEILAAKILPRPLRISAAKILPRFLNLGGQNPAETLGILAAKILTRSRRDS